MSFDGRYFFLLLLFFFTFFCFNKLKLDLKLIFNFFKMKHSKIYDLYYDQLSFSFLFFDLGFAAHG